MGGLVVGWQLSTETVSEGSAIVIVFWFILRRKSCRSCTANYLAMEVKGRFAWFTNCSGEMTSGQCGHFYMSLMLNFFLQTMLEANFLTTFNLKQGLIPTWVTSQMLDMESRCLTSRRRMEVSVVLRACSVTVWRPRKVATKKRQTHHSCRTAAPVCDKPIAAGNNSSKQRRMTH